MRPMTTIESPNIVVIGRRGCGKTSWVKEWIDNYHGRMIIVDTVGEYSGLRISSGQDLDHRLKQPLARIRIIPDKVEDVQAVVEYAFKLGNICLVIDEFAQWTSASDVPPEISKALRLGRHQGLSMLMVTQRPSNIPRMASAMADRLIIFETHEPIDCNWIKQCTSEEVADKARGLQKFSYIDYEMEGRKVRISKTRSFDNS